MTNDNAYDPDMLTDAEYEDVFGVPREYKRKKANKRTKRRKKKKNRKDKFKESLRNMSKEDRAELLELLTS